MSKDAEKFEPIFVADGDTIVIVAKTQQAGPTVSDPCDASPYLSQAYRVVSDRVGTTLALVPLGTRAVSVSQNEIDAHVGRKSEEQAAKIDSVVDALMEVIKESGWLFNAPVIESATQVLLDREIEKAKRERDEFRKSFDPTEFTNFSDGWLTANVNGKPYIRKGRVVACPDCFDECGSYACVKPSHPAWNENNKKFDPTGTFPGHK